MPDFNCPHCQTANSADATSCENCEKSVLVGKLTSLGTGVLPKGFVFELRPAALLLGRNIASDFVIPSNLIAPKQASFTYHDSGFIIQDLEQLSRCRIDGKVVESATTLPHDCTIRIGVEEFQYRFAGPKAQSQPVKKSDPLAAHLQLTLGIISEFHASLNLQEVLDNALDAVIRVSRTERAYAFLVNHDEDGNPDLHEVARRRAGGKELEDEVDDDGGYSISQSAINKVFAGDGSVIIEDAGAQQVQTDTMMRFRLQTVVCLPLLTYDHKTGRKHVMGIIYADSHSITGSLPAHCRPSLQMLTQIVTSTVVKWRAYNRMQERSQQNERASGIIDRDLHTVAEELVDLEQRVNRSGVSRLNAQEVSLELEAAIARIEAVRASLRKLGNTDA